ncbi:hypothetical protein [Kitasatospora sp. NPDC004272]
MRPSPPQDAGRLIDHGVRLTVEDSPQRVFALAEYAAVGCSTAPPGSWATGCPVEHYVLGLKELPPTPARLRHHHLMFGHAYRGQPGAPALLRRFADGGGTLLDLEPLVDDDGRRIAAFGRWAGHAGAALALLHHRGTLTAPLIRSTRGELDRRLRPPHRAGDGTSALVIGADGRCGEGACEALRTAGIAPTRWTVADTGVVDRSAVLAHDILVNAIGTAVPVIPFLTEDDLDAPPGPASGWRPPSTSMIDNRWCPNQTSPRRTSPVPSGPRCASRSSMARQSPASRSPTAATTAHMQLSSRERPIPSPHVLDPRPPRPRQGRTAQRTPPMPKILRMELTSDQEREVRERLRARDLAPGARLRLECIRLMGRSLDCRRAVRLAGRRAGGGPRRPG